MSDTINILDASIGVLANPAGTTVIYGVSDPSGTPADARFSLASLPISTATQNALDQKLGATGVPGSVVVTESTTLTDAQVGMRVFVNSATAVTVTIGTHADQAYRANAVFEIWCIGTGDVTIAVDSGASINGSNGGTLTIDEQYHAVSVVRVSEDTWVCTVPVT